MDVAPAESHHPDIPQWEELLTKLRQYGTEYLGKSVGQDHLAMYVTGRAEAAEHLRTARAHAAAGQDITNEVLLHFLPHSNTKPNKQRGAWIHIAPAVTKDVKGWFEGAGWRRPEDWPEVAKLIFGFITRCVDDPKALPDACLSFSASPYSKGFQTGLLTPFLNAIRPNDFTLINNKSRRLVNYFMGQAYRQVLTDYPAANETTQHLIASLPADLLDRLPPGGHPGDLLDAFSHWLVSIRKFDFGLVNYWKVAPGEQAWQWDECKQDGFIAVGWDEFGDLTEVTREQFAERQTSLLKEHRDWTKAGTNQVWRFAQGVAEGDIVVANLGTTEVLGFGRVTGPYYFVPGVRQGHRFPVEWYDTLRRPVNKPGWVRTLIRLEKDEVDEITAIKSPPPPPDEPEERVLQTKYTLQECAAETHIEEVVLRSWLSALERKKQAIIYGPPGTGKTFLAERLARHLVGGTLGVWELVQFHPSYAYEDFVQGIRPEVGPNGALLFNMKPGRFLEFCQKASASRAPAVLIIDEINRANLSRVFGELMYLLEYRRRQIPLSGSSTGFAIPDNIRVIGTMNTADRSIALVDHALRRRFAFIPLRPEYDILRSYHERTGTDVEPLILFLQDLNQNIGDPNLEIGVSFFLLDNLTDELQSIWQMEIEPYLEEVFYDRRDQMEDYRWGKVRHKVLVAST